MCVSNTDSGHGAEDGCMNELRMFFFCGFKGYLVVRWSDIIS